MTVRDASRRLWLARAIAWALLFSGWTVLGALGHAAARAGAWPGLPLALWLASIGVMLALGTPIRTSMRGLAAGLLLAAATTAGALLAADGGARLPLAVAPVGWAALLVLASREVKALRAATTGPVPAPIGPAALGAAIAWAVAADPLQAASRPVGIAVALLAAAALLVALRPRDAAPTAGCRAGLFDCSLPLPSGDWRRPADWPLHAAALAMLPTMAALPTMAELCATDGLGPATLAALHLAAMVAPACLLAALPVRLGRGALSIAVAALLAAGGLAFVSGSGRDALLAGMLLHAAAWSLAWAGPMLARDPLPVRRDGRATTLSALAAAAAVTAFAAAADVGGADALRGIHAALALLAFGALGALGGWGTPARTRARRPPTNR
jgi:hypothetical protein